MTLSVQVELFLGCNLRAKIGVQKLPDHDRGVQGKEFALCTIFLYFQWINRALSSIALFFPSSMHPNVNPLHIILSIDIRCKSKNSLNQYLPFSTMDLCVHRQLYSSKQLQTSNWWWNTMKTKAAKSDCISCS